MHFLITAGGTREYIDPVRFISNASTGKMGFALARAACNAGHEVTLITAVTSLRPPKDVRVIKAETCAEMFEAVKEQFDKCDCLIMAAAVSDYTPVKLSGKKIKKGVELTLKLKATPDILRWAGKNKKGRVVVGFALEDSDLRKNAEAKLRAKNLDMIIANSPCAIGAEESALQIKTPGGEWLELDMAPKSTTARKIVRLIEKP